jgi:hypothetical protein
MGMKTKFFELKNVYNVRTTTEAYLGRGQQK